MCNKEQRKAPTSWLAAARKPYLDFLRNLTAPVFLGSFGGALFTRLDSKRAYDQNTVIAVSAVIFLTAALLAFFANASLLREELFREFDDWKKDKLDELKAQGLGRWEIPKALWAEPRARRAFLLLLPLFFGLMTSLAAVMLAAIVAATELVKKFQG